MGKIRFSIDTLGCKVNQSESDFIAEKLEKMGMESVSRNRQPDFCLVNTCTVTSQSDRKARQMIRRIKSKNRESKILVTGCFAVFNREFLEDAGVDFIIENKDKRRIPDIISNAAARIAGGKERLTDYRNLTCRGSLDSGEYGNLHSRPLVKIQDGCDQNCTYCIVPKVRGGYKSLPLEDILDRIAGFQNKGFEEIVLTGIHIGKYGADFIGSKTDPRDKISNFSYLLDKIFKGTGIKRIRLSSIEVNEIDKSLLSVLEENKVRFAPHLHIPLQSGSNRILKFMGRPYTSEYYIEKISRIRKLFPHIALTTDVMVGFPGEKENDFKRTVALVERVAFSKVHVFKYSRREHTPAYNMPGQVDEKIKSGRSRILRDIGDKLRRSYIRENITKILNVVCEKMKNGDTAYGTSGNYIRVYFKMDKSKFLQLKRKIVGVYTDSSYKDGLIGRLA